MTADLLPGCFHIRRYIANELSTDTGGSWWEGAAGSQSTYRLIPGSAPATSNCLRQQRRRRRRPIVVSSFFFSYSGAAKSQYLTKLCTF